MAKANRKPRGHISPPGLVAKEWEEFASYMLPARPGTIQRKQTKRAFYAGAEHILFALMLALAEGDHTIESGEKLLHDIREELKKFRNDEFEDPIV